MTNIVGWAGCFFLLLAYVFLYFKKFRPFLVLNFVASFLLTVYSYLLNSYPFLIVNGFITLIVLKRFFEKDDFS